MPDKLDNQENFNLLYKDVITFIDFLSIEKFYSSHTAKSYDYSLKKFINDLLSQNSDIKSWKDVSDVMIRHTIRISKNFKDELVTSRTRAHLVSVLKSFYKYLLKNKIIETNVMDKISIPKFTKKLPFFASYKQIETLLQLPPNPSDKDIRLNAIIELLFSSGIRISELCNILISDLDFNNFEFRVIGKGNKERLVPFGRFAKDAIEEWLKVRNNFKPDCENLFVNRFGNKLSTRAVEIDLAKRAQAMNLPLGITPHKLRHSFATEMIAGGADLRVVQELLGHSSLGVTQVYLHLDELRIMNAYQKSHPLENDVDYKEE
ncbi:MAG: tyrosine-type recombinase/integrase [Succinivibrionaceae bacterium]|nr:tyrosine-type recombinase/integrase [Ruminobacter sp.]MDY5778485.1 tyrosine-type recombinase/integrase [Succinivibrionaceae bacterium]MEE1339609.1 tyrosine-type recombinase/integrase [Succinivibrionaceae bacterium]